MSDEYTPTTDEIRRDWVQLSADAYSLVTDDADEVAVAEFDRWLEAHDREVAEKALKPLLDYANSPVTLERDNDGDPLLSGDYVEGTLGARQDVLRIIERNPYREGASE